VARGGPEGKTGGIVNVPTVQTSGISVFPPPLPTPSAAAGAKASVAGLTRPSVYVRLATTHTDSSRAKDRTQQEVAVPQSRRSSMDGMARVREFHPEFKSKELVSIGTMLPTPAIPESVDEVPSSPAHEPEASVLDDSFACLDNVVHDGGAGPDNQENDFIADMVNEYFGKGKKRSPVSKPVEAAPVLGEVPSPTIRKRQCTRR
jgi:hypothetical protein